MHKKVLPLKKNTSKNNLKKATTKRLVKFGVNPKDVNLPDPFEAELRAREEINTARLLRNIPEIPFETFEQNFSLVKMAEIRDFEAKVRMEYPELSDHGIKQKVEELLTQNEMLKKVAKASTALERSFRASEDINQMVENMVDKPTTRNALELMAQNSNEFAVQDQTLLSKFLSSNVSESECQSQLDVNIPSTSRSTAKPNKTDIAKELNISAPVLEDESEIIFNDTDPLHTLSSVDQLLVMNPSNRDDGKEVEETNIIAKLIQDQTLVSGPQPTLIGKAKSHKQTNAPAQKDFIPTPADLERMKEQNENPTEEDEIVAMLDAQAEKKRQEAKVQKRTMENNQTAQLQQFKVKAGKIGHPELSPYTMLDESTTNPLSGQEAKFKTMEILAEMIAEGTEDIRSAHRNIQLGHQSDAVAEKIYWDLAFIKAEKSDDTYVLTSQRLIKDGKSPEIYYLLTIMRINGFTYDLISRDPVTSDHIIGWIRMVAAEISDYSHDAKISIMSLMDAAGDINPSTLVMAIRKILCPFTISGTFHIMGAIDMIKTVEARALGTGMAALQAAHQSITTRQGKIIDTICGVVGTRITTEAALIQAVNNLNSTVKKMEASSTKLKFSSELNTEFPSHLITKKAQDKASQFMARGQANKAKAQESNETKSVFIELFEVDNIQYVFENGKFRKDLMTPLNPNLDLSSNQFFLVLLDIMDVMNIEVLRWLSGIEQKSALKGIITRIVKIYKEVKAEDAEEQVFDYIDRVNEKFPKFKTADAKTSVRELKY